ncbi:hypothetical protein D8674_038687 [Pyrus ussuriensis x Pyrus communis]|uniref:Uncharacterized protein n=1 Tax=Pyrus ussuriensis x Pyrus communis TaxID=2448454 RepID=A0A5N5H5H5_9ROSA|nr:hypothetical protein D8674_038687 [Pyrus ussuriensis x Pyrus communis]
MIWLSHWRMESETTLRRGDEVLVSVLIRPSKFQLKEFGVELVQEHQNNMISTQHNTKSDPSYPFVIGGDLSMWEHIPGIYFLDCSKESVDDIDIFLRRFLNRLIMETDEEDTGICDLIVIQTRFYRAASNNCTLGGWKVLLTDAGLFSRLL